MAVLKSYINSKQEAAIKAYAVEAGLSVSNLLLNAVIEKAVRTKKYYPDGKVIVIPKKTLQEPSSARRMESKKVTL